MRARRGLLGLLAAALLAAAVGAVLPAAAAAHSALESSDPAAGSTVATAPRHVVLTFSEAPDVELSLVRLLDGAGAAVPGMSAPQVVPGDKESLRVSPATPLADGTYTVNWRVVSAADGHVESGVFAFGVGQAPGPAVEVELLHTSAWAQALADAGRWLLYAALVVIMGAASTSLFVYGGKLPSGGVVVLRTAAAVAVVALAMLAWAEKALVGAPSLLPLFLTREGQYLLALGVAVLFCIVAVVLVDLWPARWSLWILGATGVAGVLVRVLAGHAASPSSVWLLNVAVQWVHVTAVGIWVGGLSWLLLGLPARDREQRAAAVAAFSRIATGTLVVVLATGLARSLVEVGSIGALLDTRYGQVLIAKVALVAGLVALGALNHFFWVPAVSGQGGETAERRFGLNSRGELAVALVVLAATAVLSGLAPAATAVAAPGGAPASGVTASGHDYATSVRVELTLTPGVAGRNAYVLRADDYDTGDPLPTVTDVRMRCSLPARPSMAEVTVPLSRATDGSWKGSGLDFSVAGRWEIEVYVREKTSGTTVPLEVTVAPAP